MEKRLFPLLLTLGLLAGCFPGLSVSDLKPGMSKEHIVARWGQPTVVPRTMEIRDGTIMEIYQYETGFPKDLNTLYFRDGKLWYWDKKDWRGSSLSEYVPGTKK